MSSITRPTTIVDVARLADVSTATVSRVLNGKQSVDPELARRVRDAVDRANYVPNGAGRTLRRSRSDLWAIIVPDVRNGFFTAIMESFEAAALASGHTVVLCNTHEDLAREKAYVDQMMAQQVSGIVLAATSATQSSVSKLSDAGIPVILFDRRLRNFDGDIVVVDDEQVGHLAAEHMIEQGVRRPFLFTGAKTVSSTVDREHGFLQAMRAACIDVPKSHVLRLDITARDAPAELAAKLAECPDIDGLFAASGPLTSDAFTALRTLRWPMPERVVLVGVDNEHWTQMVTPRVTLVSQPVQEVGRWAAHLLEARSNGDDLDPARIVLAPTLIVRESSLRTV